MKYRGVSLTGHLHLTSGATVHRITINERRELEVILERPGPLRDCNDDNSTGSS